MAICNHNDSKGIFAKDALTTLGLLLDGKAYAIRSITSECKPTDKKTTFLRIKTNIINGINQFKTDVTTSTCENLLAKKFDTQLQIDDLENNHYCDTRMIGETIDSFNRSNISDSK